MANIYDTLTKLGSGLQQAELTADNNTNQNTQSNVKNDYIYDGDTTYKDGVGYRSLGIDTPEMDSAKELKLQRLAKAKESKVGMFASKATAGEAAKLEAELSVLNGDASIENRDAVIGTDAFGRKLTQNEAYKKDMIARGYAVPTFFDESGNTIEEVNLMNEAKANKKGLWADPEYAKEMGSIVDKRILNNSKVDQNVKDAAEYAKYDGTLTKEDFMGRGTGESGFVDGLQGTALKAYGLAQKGAGELAGSLGQEELAKKLDDRGNYLVSGADDFVGYKGNNDLVNKIRGFQAGTADVGNKIVSLIGEGLQSLGEADAKFLGKEQERLDKNFSGEQISDWRKDLSSWMKEAGDNLQKESIEFKKANKAQKWAGYDSTNVDTLSKEVEETIAKDGYLSAFGRAVTDARSLDVLVNSLPEMIALAASVGGMAVANTNINLDLAKDKAGRELTPSEKAMSTASSVVGTYLDRLGDKLALNGMNPAKEALKIAIDSAPAAVKNGLSKEYGKAILKIGEAPLRVGAAAGLEGATEYSQTLGEEAAQNVDVFKNGFSDEQLKEAGVAGVLGAAMGGQIATPVVGVDLAKEASGAIKALADANEAKVTEQPASNVNETFSNKDVNSVLGSTATDAEKFNALSDLVSEMSANDSLTEEAKNKLEQDIVSSGAKINVADVVATGEDLGVIKKSATAVSREVSEGPKGFLTYYNKAVNAKNDKEFEDSVTNLESFMKSQQDKIKAFNSEEDRILAEYQSEADLKGISLEDLYKSVKDKNTKEHYTYGDNNKKAWIKKEAVLEKFLSGNENFNGSSYAYINDVKKELDAMTRLHSKLVDTSVNDESAPVVEELGSAVKNWIDTAISEKGYDAERAINAINSNKNATPRQKELAIEYVNKVVSDKEVVKDKLKEVLTKDRVNEGYTAEEEQLVQNAIDDGVLEEVAKELQDKANTKEVRVPEKLIKYTNAQLKAVKTAKDLDKLRSRVVSSTNKDVVENREAVLKLIDSHKIENRKPKEAKEVVKDVNNAISKVEVTKRKLEEAKAVDDESAVEELKKELDEVNKELDKSNNTIIKSFESKKVYGSGISSKFGSSVFTSTGLTGLSVVDEVSADKAVKDVESVMSPLSFKKNGEVAFDSPDSPAKYFVFNSDGKVDSRIAVAIDAASNNFMIDLVNDLNRMDDVEFQKRFSGVDVQDPDVALNWMNRATPLRFEAESIGAQVLSNLGIKVARDVTMTYEQGLKADLGMVALAVLEKKGFVKIGKVGNVHAVSTGENLDYEVVKLKALDYENSYGIEFNGGRTFSLSKPSNSRKVPMHHQPLTDATQEQQDLINEQEKMAYRLNDGFDVLKEIFGNKEEVKKALGKGTKFKSKYKIDAQKSIEREIDNSVDSLFDLARLKDKDGNNVDVWFKWFLSKNGRFVMDSTTVNPQTDKLHRFLVNAESARSKVSEEDIVDINRSVSEEDRSLGFKYAVVQAFDGAKFSNGDGVSAIDKKSRSAVEKDANRLIKLTDEELFEMAKQSDHIGHAAVAISSIRKLREGKPFESNLTVEFDGLTNGFAFKMLQSPLGDFQKWLPRVGVIEESNDKFNSVNSIAELKADGMLDTYEVLGSLAKFPDYREFELVDELIKAKGLPDVYNKKSIRSLLKGPVMVFNYGAGVASISRAIVSDLLIEAVEAVADSSELKKKFGVSGINFREVAIGSPELKPFVSALTSEIEEVYARPIVSALEEEFSEAIEYNKAVNGSFGLLFKEFSDKYAEEVRARNYGRVLPPKEVNDQIIKDLLKKVGPIISGPTTKGELDRILVSQRGVTDINKLLDSSTAITSVKSSANVKGESLSISLVVRGLGEPGAAGGVLPTHTADGTVQGKTIKNSKGGYLGVHDAMVVGLDQLSSAKDYNKHWYDVNKEYSIINSLVDEVSKLNGLSAKDSKIVSNLISYASIIDSNREFIFNQNLKIGQMVGLPGTMYEVKSKGKNVTISNKQVLEKTDDNVVEKNNVLKDVNVDSKVVGDLIKSIKDC